VRFVRLTPDGLACRLQVLSLVSLRPGLCRFSISPGAFVSCRAPHGVACFSTSFGPDDQSLGCEPFDLSRARFISRSCRGLCVVAD